MKHIPNIITCLNLASGFIAVIMAANGDLTAASWLIGAAMVFDFLDGFSARLLKAYSDIGRELDSLADIVSFGVAPAIIIYRLIDSSSPVLTAGILPVIYHLVPVIMPVCSGLRLAKFNIDTTQTVTFRGLPTPANAIAVISVIIAVNYSDSELIRSVTGSPLLVSIYSLIISLLMVTRIPLLSLKIKNFRLKGNEGRYLLTGLVVISFAILGFSAAPLIIPFYILASLIDNRFFSKESSS